MLALAKEPTVAEVAAELVELQGIASEEEVPEYTVSTEEILKGLAGVDKIQTFSEPKRYKLTC